MHLFEGICKNALDEFRTFVRRLDVALLAIAAASRALETQDENALDDRARLGVGIGLRVARDLLDHRDAISDILRQSALRGFADLGSEKVKSE